MERVAECDHHDHKRWNITAYLQLTLKLLKLNSITRTSVKVTSLATEDC